MDDWDQNAQAITLQCPFTDCDAVTTNVDKEIALALFNAHIATHTMASAPAAARTARVEMKKPDRPIVKEDSTDQDWAIFEFEWGRYCTAVGITAREDVLRSEILNCCDPALR